jgi:hypothetical protein
MRLPAAVESRLTPESHDVKGIDYCENGRKPNGSGRIRTAGLLRVKEPS